MIFLRIDLCWHSSGHADIFINQRIECYLNNTINLRPLTSTHYAVLYPQYVDRIAAIDSVTSVHRYVLCGFSRGE